MILYYSQKAFFCGRGGNDAAGQLLTEDGPFASDVVTNTYQNRLRTALSLQQPTGAWTNGFIYDAARRLTNVTSPAGAFGYQLASTVPSLLPIKGSVSGRSDVDVFGREGVEGDQA